MSRILRVFFISIFERRTIERNNKRVEIFRENTKLKIFKCCVFDEIIEFSTIVNKKSKINETFNFREMSKIDDVTNVVVVNIDFDIVLNDRLNNNVIKKILNRREFLENESSDEKTKTTNFDSFTNIKFKKIENSSFLSKREFFFSIVFCCLFTQIL